MLGESVAGSVARSVASSVARSVAGPVARFIVESLFVGVSCSRWIYAAGAMRVARVVGDHVLGDVDLFDDLFLLFSFYFYSVDREN